MSVAGRWPGQAVAAARVVTCFTCALLMPAGGWLPCSTYAGRAADEGSATITANEQCMQDSQTTEHQAFAARSD